VPVVGSHVGEDVVRAILEELSVKTDPLAGRDTNPDWATGREVRWLSRHRVTPMHTPSARVRLRCIL